MAKKTHRTSVTKLQQQLHGKSANTPTVTHQHATPTQVTPAGFKLSPATPLPSSSSQVAADTRYLRHDLTKILILSTIAIGAQFLLYFGLRHGLTIRGF